MNKIVSLSRNFVSRFRKDEKGTQLVETAVWLAIITTTAVTVITAIGPAIEGVMTRIRDAIV